MTVSGWLKARSVELGASICTAGVLFAGLALGVPFLRERIPETFLYSFCCVTAVLLRALIDLSTPPQRIRVPHHPAGGAGDEPVRSVARLTVPGYEHN